jgi:hypothetical protein
VWLQPSVSKSLQSSTDLDRRDAWQCARRQSPETTELHVRPFRPSTRSVNLYSSRRLCLIAQLAQLCRFFYPTNTFPNTVAALVTYFSTTGSSCRASEWLVGRQQVGS